MVGYLVFDIAQENVCHRQTIRMPVSSIFQSSSSLYLFMLWLPRLMMNGDKLMCARARTLLHRIACERASACVCIGPHESESALICTVHGKMQRTVLVIQSRFGWLVFKKFLYRGIEKSTTCHAAHPLTPVIIDSLMKFLFLRIEITTNDCKHFVGRTECGKR